MMASFGTFIKYKNDSVQKVLYTLAESLYGSFLGAIMKWTVMY
ncbi:hypothetical protein [Bartonella tribocorum]|nr:hypothetical protein [Bartonella tribocorum]CDO47876.1 hypothetical protein BM1374166_00183 [Bartonella tribocorum]